MFIDLPILDPADARAPQHGVKAWRSYDHLHQTDEFRRLHRAEFMPEATSPPTASNRRDFLKIMGASMAMAGLTACRRPVEKILPYSRKPEEVIPGKALFYATAMPFGGVVQGVLAESHEGRPTKIEPNPEHPLTFSGTNGFAQASILNLYDPDRSPVPIHDGTAATWGAFVDFCRSYQPNGRVAVLAEPSSSPTLERMRGLLENRFPDVLWVTYNAVADDGAAQGSQLAFGQPLRPLYKFSQADVIVSLDANFLGGTNPNLVHDAREYAESRRVLSTTDTMSRLYVVESMYTTTGGMADHRLRLKPSEIPAFAAALAARLGVSDAAEAGSRFAGHPWVAAVADDLQASQGRGLLLAGASQPPVVHALCAAVNQQLGNTGTTVQWLDTEADAPRSQADALRELVDAMTAGQVDLLLMLNTNPAYSAPGDLNFAEAMGRVNTLVHVGLWLDETAVASHWHLPASHFLEAWGDGRAYDGTLSVIQPLMAPLYASKSPIEVLNVLATGSDRSGYDLVRETWRPVLPENFEDAWREVVHDGFLADSQYATVQPDGAASLTGALNTLPTAASDAIDIQFYADEKVYDGTYANNAWMQEIPDTATKLVWDNAAIMSRATRERLGLRFDLVKQSHWGDLVELTLDGRSVILPIWELPGHADDAITVAIGYGRTLLTTRDFEDVAFYDIETSVYKFKEAPLANGVGTNVAPLRPANAMQMASGVEVTAVGELYELVSTQDHGMIEGSAAGRVDDLIRMATIDEYKAHPRFAYDQIGPLQELEPWEEYPTLWEYDDPYADPRVTEARYFENQWGMTIDLNTCNGCNACVVACYSENNVQVVGKEQVGMGREMSWLRIDRYYTGDDPDNPGLVTQPMACVHCEDAPCEPVCPVAATVHSPDGMNMMIYNRCIGTRYCNNNCPYKVRRFNYFNWTKNLPTTVWMAQNPNVTVRFRGVMEKCQYCVQRIRRAGIEANIEDRDIRDDEVQTACQQACPANAIVFGNLANRDSAVSELKRNDRRYEVLADLNVKPRTSYLARLRNPNPALAPSET